jgi:hypothetical protein
MSKLAWLEMMIQTVSARTSAAAAPDESGEWLYFGHGKLGGSIFLVHHEDDGPMQKNTTVFGFGRIRSHRQILMQNVLANFSIGLCVPRDYHTVKKVIHLAYRVFSIRMGKLKKSGASNNGQSRKKGEKR